MNGSTDFLPNMRAAFRQRLLATSMPTVAPGVAAVVSATARTITCSAVDFPALGFRAGDYMRPSGFSRTANNVLARLKGVAVGSLVLDSESLVAESKTGVTLAVPLPSIAYEAEVYDPISGQPFIREVMQTVGREVLGLGGVNEDTLLATATLFYPAGRGTIGVESMAGRLVERFKAGTVLAYGGDGGKVIRCEPSPLNSEPDWVSISVMATVVAWTLN